jgi:hypothetical protein
MIRVAKPKKFLRWAAAAAALAAIGCGDTTPEVKLGKLVVVAGASGGGGGVSGEEWQMILEHERREIEYFECSRDQPVCGTDGMRYANPCQAMKAGVQVDSNITC